jgi:hypothetical protein
MQQWINELKSIDSIENHNTNLDRALEAFLTSDYANCKTHRTNTVILFSHLKKLDKVKSSN